MFFWDSCSKMLSEYMTCPVSSQVSYRAQQEITSNPVIKMVAIWVFAFLLYCPAILFWDQTQHGSSRSALRQVLWQLVLPPLCVHPGVLCAAARGDLLQCAHLPQCPEAPAAWQHAGLWASKEQQPVLEILPLAKARSIFSSIGSRRHRFIVNEVIETSSDG